MTVPRLSPGHIVAGKYTVRGELGRGQVSVTYSAITAPNREIALRIYDPSVPSVAKSIDRLRGMCAATSALSPRLIVPMVDVGVDLESGAPYSATPLVAVPSLAQLVELCPLDVGELPAFAISLARAIDALHSAGIAHLGLSPANVFVGPAPERVVQLTDAGVHGIFSDAARGRSLLWLAPEQVEESGTSGFAADVFTAGLLVFHALTGRSFLSAVAQAVVDRRAWRDAIAALPSASARARALGVELTPLADAAFRTALALAPGDRFATVSHFAAALAQALAPGTEAQLTGDREVPVPQEAHAIPSRVPQRDVPAVLIEAPPSIAEAPRPVLVPSEGALAIDTGPAFLQSAPAVEVAPRLLDSAPDIAQRLIRSRRTLLLVAGGLGFAFLTGVTLIALSIRSWRNAPPAATARTAPHVTTEPIASAPPTAPVMADGVPPTATESRAAPSKVLDTGQAELLVECEPVSCTGIALDGKLSSQPGPFVVHAGAHGVGVSRKGYVGQWRRVEVPAGEQTVVRFTLTPTSPTTKKSCGKFLERCD